MQFTSYLVIFIRKIMIPTITVKVANTVKEDYKPNRHGIRVVFINLLYSFL